MARTTMNMEYFATLQDPDQLANKMQEKIREWRTWASGRGLIDLWARKLANYYGNSPSGNSSQAIVAGGSEGELALMKVNDLHQLLQEQLVTVTSQRPAGQARAINSNVQSLKSAKIGTAIAEYYMAQVGLEAKYVQCAEIALLLDEGFTDLFWDKSGGDPIAVDETGEPMMSGDVGFRVHCPWNAARDPGMKADQQSWYILSYLSNKFDSAAKYPKFEQDILSCGPDDPIMELGLNFVPDSSDAIWHHLLIHDRTASVSKGRYSLMIGEKIVLDTDLPYKDFPVDRMTPSDVIDGCTGYASANDIMGLEQMTDGLHTIIATNEIKFGGQNIIAPEGNNIKVSDLAKGSRFFEVAADMVDKVRALELCRTPPEVFNYIGLLGSKKERAVGSVQSSLAQQAAQGASGNSMALIQVQAISYNSGTQRSYFRLLSSSMSKLIGILRVYADTPRVARIVGKSKAAGLKEFKYTGEDLNSISSIVYEMVNPASQTFGGRLTMGQDLLKAGQIKSPKQYINLVTTGQTEVLTEDDEADGMLILEENEALTEGRPVKAVVTEIHADHIRSHNSLISQQSKESDPDLVQRVLAHVQEHIDIWTQASMQNPGILAATGQQPLPPPMAPPPAMMPPGGGAGPGGPPPPGAPKGVGKQVGDGQAPAVRKAEETNLPSLPNIPGTKEKPPVPGVTDQAS